MGPQISPADIPPPARVLNIPAHNLSAPDASSRFDGYLDEARSRAADTPANTTNKPAPKDQPPEPAVEDKRSKTRDTPDGNDQTPENPTGPAPTVAPQTPVVPAVAPQDAVPVPTTTTANEAQSAQSVTPTPNTQNPAQTAPPPNVPPQQTLSVAPDANQPAAPSPQAAETPTAIPQPTADEKGLTQSARDQLATAADKASQNASDQAQAAIQATKDQPQQTAKGALSQIANQSDTSRRAAASAPSDETPRQATAHDSPQPQRIGPPADARQQRLVDSRKTDTQLQPIKTAPHPQIRATKRLAVSPQIRDGQGDGAAASIARFLVSSNASSGTAATNTPSAVSSPGASGLVATTGTNPGAASPPPQAALVADLLAANVQGSDGIDGAARLLHASGKAGRFKATMQLDPPELGQLKVQIQLHPQGMNLQVHVATRAVARLIETNLANLKDALGVHGIQIDRAHVTVRTPAHTQSDHQTANDQGAPSHGQSGRQAMGRHAGGDNSQRHRIIDPHPVVELDSGPYEKNVAAPGGFGAQTIHQNRPTTELSVDLVA